MKLPIAEIKKSSKPRISIFFCPQKTVFTSDKIFLILRGQRYQVGPIATENETFGSCIFKVKLPLNKIVTHSGLRILHPIVSGAAVAKNVSLLQAEFFLYTCKYVSTDPVGGTVVVSGRMGPPSDIPRTLHTELRPLLHSLENQIPP